ncbi:hypothetical protein HDU96_000231 [Phlyctochytrium bullatum]|nr:hypothetical protein HDU96_000231 [Phlyctochytrium bullatum]
MRMLMLISTAGALLQMLSRGVFFATSVAAIAPRPMAPGSATGSTSPASLGNLAAAPAGSQHLHPRQDFEGFHPAAPPGPAPPSSGLLADFVPDRDYLLSTLRLDVVDADADPCLVREGCLGGLGVRKVLRFGTMVHNVGDADAVLGTPPAAAGLGDLRYWHWHFTAYARYTLHNADGSATRAKGTKSGFCLEDSVCPDPTSSGPKFHCRFQGVTRGCADIYDETLPCQWIDITDLFVEAGEAAVSTTANATRTATVAAAGPTVVRRAPAADVWSRTYRLRVQLNPEGAFPEKDLSNNAVEVEVVLGNVPRVGGEWD